MSVTPPKVTSLEEIRNQANPVIELPGWDEGQAFYARVRRVSLVNLVARGQIPNELLGIAHKFLESGKKKANPLQDMGADELTKFAELMVAVAQAVLVEPTYEEIVEAAGSLTEEQLQAIYLYALRGSRALELFRKQPRDPEEVGVHGEGVEQSAE